MSSQSLLFVSVHSSNSHPCLPSFAIETILSKIPIFERLYLVSGPHQFAFFVTFPYAPTTPLLSLQLFFDFVPFCPIFSLSRPSIFVQQVIWPSLVFSLSFFLAWFSKNLPNHWTKRMAIDLAT